ncbi:MAG: SRPBCC domain-containing protein [Bacteroidetes bacterium]|nr:SRPBCC domain-containing protein [Bacteroidota bacterium]MBS1685422.1 SRPBCC domain-containing protein [Bacteroidota bacterium]
MTNTHGVREVTITRDFAVTPQVLFEDWIYPNKFCRWWGPKDYINSHCQIHPQQGGAMLVHMQAPDGTTHQIKGLFHEVQAPERIVMTTYALDESGHPLLEVLHTVTFAGHHTNTRLSVTSQVVNAKPDGVKYMATMEQGWRESLDKLARLTLKE